MGLLDAAYNKQNAQTGQGELIDLGLDSKIYYDDSAEMNDDMTRYKDKYVKLIVVNKKDLYQFDKFVDNIYQKAKPYDLKIIEDYSDLDATTVADDIVEQSEDTPTLLDTYIEQTDTTLDKGRLKTLMKTKAINLQSEKVNTRKFSNLEIGKSLPRIKNPSMVE